MRLHSVSLSASSGVSGERLWAVRECWYHHIRLWRWEERSRSRSILIICRLDWFDRMACTTGKENFPSVRSSAKPLLVVYYRIIVFTSIERLVRCKGSDSPGQTVGSYSRHGFESIFRSGSRVERSHYSEFRYDLFGNYITHTSELLFTIISLTANRSKPPVSAI